MLISDATNLKMLKAGGAQLITAPAGDFWAIFDNVFIEVSGVETRQTILTCRTSDIQLRQLEKETPLGVGNETYRIKRHEPDGTGMSRILLKR